MEEHPVWRWRFQWIILAIKEQNYNWFFKGGGSGVLKTTVPRPETLLECHYQDQCRVMEARAFILSYTAI